MATSREMHAAFDEAQNFLRDQDQQRATTVYDYIVRLIRFSFEEGWIAAEEYALEKEAYERGEQDSLLEKEEFLNQCQRDWMGLFTEKII